ncbi:MAG: AMP-binding protein [Crocinitomicaceae bacterium]
MLDDFILLDDISEDYLHDIKAFIEEWNNDEDYIEVTTSGTTADPKTLRLKKKRVRAAARATGRFFLFKKGQTALLNLSPLYIAGKLMIVRAIEYEMKLAVAPLQGNPLKNIPDTAIYFGAFVPSQIVEIIKDEKSTARLNSIQHIIIGGAPLEPDLENELLGLKAKIFASFGMTETITHFALRKIGTPIYKCLSNYSIAVDDESCLVIRPNDIVEELLFTNDVIDYIDHQTFKWRGRLDNVINSGGVKIHPEKAEKMIAHLLPDNRFYVTSKKDEKYGEVAVLVVEGDPGNDEILEDAKASLPRHHAPKELIIEDKFEVTPTQKIIRKKF